MLNHATIQGRLTTDPEIRHTQSGTAVCRATVAIDRGYVKPGEERKTDFVDILVWDKKAEFLTTYFHKGGMLVVEGAIQTGSYEDKNGVKRKTFEVVASNIHFCESKKDSQSQQQAPQQSHDTFVDISDDDDLPF